MKPFSLLIKPASADCNLRCSYCFYLPKSRLYSESETHRMSGEVLERLVSSYMKTDQPRYVFGWQGGEPTLMGRDFFENVVQLQQEYGDKGAIVNNGLQTNATMINAAFAKFLGMYKFLVGVSLDGPPDIHDHYRKDEQGHGSHRQVLRTVMRLKRQNVSFNALTLVNDKNVNRAGDIYRYLRDQGFSYHQYIPCVEFDENGNLLPWSISGEEWGQFLCELFDEWKKSDSRRVSIRLFDSILEYLVNGTRNTCVMGDSCSLYFLVEHNGDVYPCDFFVEPKWKIGNIMEQSWEEMQNSPVYARFAEQKRKWNEQCNGCDYLEICAGDCLKHRLYNQNSPETISWLCKGWKEFYDHSLDWFRKCAKELS